MTDFERMVNSGLPLTWGTIWLGWHGPSCHPSVISSKEVISYATDQLVRGVVDYARYVADLASTEVSDTRNVERVLWRVASLEGFDADTETLKWEVVLLRKLMESLSSDPLDALADLTDFWLTFDQPAHSPHTIQGVGNSITPQEYYTQENLARTLHEHHGWLELRESELRV